MAFPPEGGYLLIGPVQCPRYASVSNMMISSFDPALALDDEVAAGEIVSSIARGVSTPRPQTDPGVHEERF